MKMKIIAALCALIALSSVTRGEATDPAIINLPQWAGSTMQTMIRDMGTPITELTYTIGTAPTKGWNHGLLFTIYPKGNPDNADIPIKELVWDQGQYEVRACFHLVKKAWLSLGAMKIDKSVRF